MRTEGTNLRVVLYEGDGARPLADATRLETLTALLENGFEVTRPAPTGEVMPEDAASILVLGDFEGAPPTIDAAPRCTRWPRSAAKWQFPSSPRSCRRPIGG